MNAETLLTVAAFVSAVLCIGSEYTHQRRWFYLLKPLTMVWIIALAIMVQPTAGSPAFVDYRFWIIAGLCCSLAGDVLLMLPTDRFLAGLGAFLIAHWCYIIALAGLPTDPNWLVAAPWIVAGVALFVLLKPANPVVRVAVLAYIVSILLMGWLAVENWRLSHAGTVVALAAVLFIFSDTMIGFRRFRRKWSSAQALILGSYFPAQWLFAVSPAFL